MNMAGTFFSIGRNVAAFWSLASCINACYPIAIPSTTRTKNRNCSRLDAFIFFLGTENQALRTALQIGVDPLNSQIRSMIRMITTISSSTNARL